MYFKRHRIVLLAIAILVLTGGVIRAEDKIIKAEKVTDTKVQKDTANEGLKRSAEELSIANKFFIFGGYYTSDRAYLGFGYEGATGSVSRQIEIFDNVPPVASFTAPSIVTEGEVVVVDASSSSDIDGAIASYEFDFGDQSPVGGKIVSGTKWGVFEKYPIISIS